MRVFTCPNRNGGKKAGADVLTATTRRLIRPIAVRRKTITEQLEEGKRFFGRKYPDMKFLAYFQAYTNTYGEVDEVIRKYEEALAVPDVVGIVIGTRPDCMPQALLDYLTGLNRRTFLMVEYGIESVDDGTLVRINRGHTFAETEETVRRTADAGIRTGGHIILGLPGEKRDELVGQAALVSRLPLTALKIHQLQLIRGTRMAHEYVLHPEQFHLYTADEYIELVIDYIERLRSDLVLERFVSQSPKDLLIAPDWGLKNYEFTERLKRRMKERGAWQGRLADRRGANPLGVCLRLFASYKILLFRKVIRKKLRGYVFFIYFCGTCEA